MLPEKVYNGGFWKTTRYGISIFVTCAPFEGGDARCDHWP